VELQFKYEEEEHSIEFFTPYIWCIAYNYNPDLYWNPESIRLFSLSQSDPSVMQELEEEDFGKQEEEEEPKNAQNGEKDHVTLNNTTQNI
jgi:hypothetical protein